MLRLGLHAKVDAVFAVVLFSLVSFLFMACMLVSVRLGLSGKVNAVVAVVLFLHVSFLFMACMLILVRLGLSRKVNAVFAVVLFLHVLHFCSWSLCSFQSVEAIMPEMQMRVTALNSLPKGYPQLCIKLHL